MGTAFKISSAAAAAAAYSSTAALVGGGSAAGAAAAAAAADSRGVSFFPTLGLHSKHEEISVNFGAAPFTFDLQSFEDDVLAEFEAAVSSIHLPPLPVLNMVRQHLAFAGMHASLQALDKQVGSFAAYKILILREMQAPLNSSSGQRLDPQRLGH